MKPSDQQLFIAEIDALKQMIVDMSIERGRDPVDAMMMMLIAASQLYREIARDPLSLGEIHEALDKAYEAATSWWTRHDQHGSKLQ